MWNILLQVAAAFVVGAAVGYGFATIVEALSRAFSKLWENLIIASQEIFGYLREATKYYLALVAQFLDNNWSDIESYLRQEFGYLNCDR
jgi:protein tyrosine/serine phosphatase